MYISDIIKADTQMEKIYGTTIRQDGLMKVGRKRWELFYGFGKDNDDDEAGYNYRQVFAYKPTLEEIKAIIIGQINKITDEKILSGLVWNDIPIWLSSENQFNYKAAYDLAIQTNGESLPVTFKFGTDSEPVYHTFDTLSEFQKFYITSLAYVQQVLADGWNEKDNIDWNIFL